MRDINDINIFDRAMSFEDINDILLTAPRTDISQYIKPDDRDFLDKSIEEYEANVPLLTQIGVGFTPPGMAIDVAAAGKYGRDAFRDFGEGEIGKGFKNLGIAGLSGLAAIPLVGELAALAKQPVKASLKAPGGISSIPKGDTLPGKVVADRIRKGNFPGMGDDLANKIEKLPQVNYSTLDEMLPDFVSGGDIRKVTRLDLSGPEVAANMRKIQTEGGIPYLSGFADEVEKLGSVTAKDLDKMLPDYVSYSDIRLVTNPMSKGIASLSDDMLDLQKILDDPKLSNADKAKQIENHPAIVKAEKKMNDIIPTEQMPGYGTPEWAANRQFNFAGKDVVGYSAAADELYQGGRSLAYIEQGLEVPANVMAKNSGKKIATIVIGPPAAGKSAISNPLAIKYNATIIDPDEAKKVLPEFQGGVGGNAVHAESQAIINDVAEIAMQRGDNLLFPTVGGNPQKIRNKINILKDNGYEVNLVLTDLDPDLAMVRMNQRFIKKGRLINSDAANNYKGKPNKTYDILKKEGIADGYGKIDTTTRIGEPKKIFDDTAEIFKDTNL
jgi:predicted ABC-type ATPase